MVLACQDENTFGPNFKPDKMGHMMKMDQSDITFQAAGGSQTVQVKAKGPHWKFTGSPEWLTISPSEGSGDRSVTFTATENTATAERTATIRFESDENEFVHAKPFTVRQAGVARHTSATATPLSFATDGGSQDIAVTSNEEWTATVTPAEAVWCSVSPSTATGNGTLTVTAAENKTIDPRTATITIKGQTSGDETSVSVTQKGAEAYITVSPQKWDATSPDAATQTITVSSNTSWTCASSDDAWCKVTPASATAATVTITANATTKARKATLTFKAVNKEATVEVTQPGHNAELSVSPTALEFERVPTAGQTVTVNCNENWNVACEASWCKGENKTAAGFTVTVTQNQSLNTRTATINVTSDSGKTATVSVKQKGGSIDYEDYGEDTQLALANTTYTANGVSFTMVAVEGGTFQMGSTTGKSDEQPVHEVKLSAFSIGQTEVTQELWEAVMGSNPSYFKGQKLPVEWVSWHDCQTFISKLNQLTGKQFRLPTEAEWEFAARGGTKSKGYTYSGSNTIDDVAWYWSNSGNKTHEVATKQANELGIYDMSGNVWEWCQDWYSKYSSSAINNPTGPTSGSIRVYRGGSWVITATNCRVAYRYSGAPEITNDSLGFRLAL